MKAQADEMADENEFSALEELVRLVELINSA
jgi:hypothetical protein